MEGHSLGHMRLVRALSRGRSLLSGDTRMVHIWEVNGYVYAWVVRVWDWRGGVAWSSSLPIRVKGGEYAYNTCMGEGIRVWAEVDFCHVTRLIRVCWSRNMVIRVWGWVIRIWAVVADLAAFWCVLSRFGQLFELPMILVNSNEGVCCYGLYRSVFEDGSRMIWYAASMSVMSYYVVHFDENVVIPEGITVSMWLTCMTKVGRVDVDCIVLNFALYVIHHLHFVEMG